jgi:hypothetical protein
LALRSACLLDSCRIRTRIEQLPGE